MFKEPKEPRVPCVQCRSPVPVGDALFDTYAEHYLCDANCYHEWADDNHDIISDYYQRDNIEG